MPIVMQTYIRKSPTDNSFGIPPPTAPAEQVPVVLSTQRDYRFSGYHLTRDGDGNIVLTMPPSAWLNQPAMYARQAISTGTFDLR